MIEGRSTVNANQSYRTNQPAVIAEVIDGEAIIVNLDSGAYYSLRDSACAIWELVAQQMTVPQVVQALTTRYAGPRDAIESGVAALLEQLLAEQIILPAAAASSSAGAAALPSNGARGLLPFQPPVLEKFTDMADLLLLDPIHEVDEAGWPHPAPAR